MYILFAIKSSGWPRALPHCFIPAFEAVANPSWYSNPSFSPDALPALYTAQFSAVLLRLYLVHGPTSDSYSHESFIWTLPLAQALFDRVSSLFPFQTDKCKYTDSRSGNNRKILSRNPTIPKNSNNSPSLRYRALGRYNGARLY